MTSLRRGRTNRLGNKKGFPEMVTYSRSPWRCRSSLWKEMEQSGALVLTLPESQAAENPTPMKAAWATGQHPWAVREPEAGPALGFLSRKLS